MDAKDDNTTLLEKEVHKMAQELDIPIERVYEVLRDHYLQEGEQDEHSSDDKQLDNGDAVQEIPEENQAGDREEGTEAGDGGEEDTGGQEERTTNGGEVEDMDGTGIDFDTDPEIDEHTGQIIHE